MTKVEKNLLFRQKLIFWPMLLAAVHNDADYAAMLWEYIEGAILEAYRLGKKYKKRSSK